MNRVLLVDDHADVLQLLDTMVSNLGFEPLTAASVNEAVDIYDKSKPGIILTDLKFNKGADGVALCSYINRKRDGAVVMCMSGFFTEFDKTFCTQAGFQDFLTKPIAKDDLSSALVCAFERRQRWLNLPYRNGTRNAGACAGDDLFLTRG